MSDVPVQVVIAAFSDEQRADQVLEELKAAQKEHLIDIQNAAVLRCDAQGKVHISETANMGVGKGMLGGGVVGGVIGIFGSVLVAPIAVGALAGGLWAKLRDRGFSDEKLKEIGDALKPGTSAIIAVIEHTWVAEVERRLQEEGARVVTESLKADIAEQLEAGHDVAYTALSAAGVEMVARAEVDPAAAASPATTAAPATSAPSAAPASPTT